jgi:hypothetical protein
MYTLRSIDPKSGYMKDFKLEVDEPVLIGRVPLEIILEYPDLFLKDAPEPEIKHLSDYIKSTKRLITLEECDIHDNSISRVHCMIFPGEELKILDLYSTNGTILANIGGGMELEPGKRTEIQHNTTILLAQGAAIFQYFSFDKCERDELAFEEDMVNYGTELNI